MPPKKGPLLDVLQDLPHWMRGQFPFCPNDDEDFRQHVMELRKMYAFKYLPNDYLIRKRRLPEKPEKLKTKERIPIPLPENYVEVNYTELPDLPACVEEVKKVNLTLPLANTKEIMIAVKELRKYYYFRKIPEEWIELETKEQRVEEG
ncbi:2229_t:CDS:2, partial [Gigaspora rosea]